MGQELQYDRQGTVALVKGTAECAYKGSASSYARLNSQQNMTCKTWLESGSTSLSCLHQKECCKVAVATGVATVDWVVPLMHSNVEYHEFCNILCTCVGFGQTKLGRRKVGSPILISSVQVADSLANVSIEGAALWKASHCPWYVSLEKWVVDVMWCQSPHFQPEQALLAAVEN